MSICGEVENFARPRRTMTVARAAYLQLWRQSFCIQQVHKRLLSKGILCAVEPVVLRVCYAWGVTRRVRH